jgi:SAM-dependent methyltransferase
MPGEVAAVERILFTRCVARRRDRARVTRDWGQPLSRQLAARFRRPAFLGTLRRTSPISRDWGFNRGSPVDRYYIERFLWENRADIRGRVLELMDSGYSDLYGTGVSQADVLDIDPSNERATIVDDLAVGKQLPTDAFDCFILTQTLHIIYDVRGAIETANRVLRPGGVLLATMPAVSRIWREGADFWRFTEASALRLFRETFGENLEVASQGNVLTAIAFLTGLAHEELSRRELETNDPLFPVTITVRAVKS